MATTTTNLGLTKPAYTEQADISVINSNMDTIDSAIGTLQSQILTLQSSIESLESQVGMDTLYSDHVGASSVTLSKPLTGYRFLRVGYSAGTLGEQTCLLDTLQYTYHDGWWHITFLTVHSGFDQRYGTSTAFNAKSETSLAMYSDEVFEATTSTPSQPTIPSSARMIADVVYYEPKTQVIQYVYGIK